MGYYETNIKTIDSAFANLAKTKDLVIQRGMKNLLVDAVAFALASHDEHHQMHIRIGDSYGWLLAHNGNIVDSEIYIGKRFIKDKPMVMDALKNCGFSTNGWVGVVMAGLEPPKYFAVEYESGVLENTINNVEQNINTYFKAI